MTYLIVGGSAGVGRALAEVFAGAGHPLVLVSRDIRDTQALAADLSLRFGVSVMPVTLDLAHRQVSFAAIDDALRSCPPLGGILLPIGMTHPEDRPGQPDSAFEDTLNANFYSPCRLINHLLPLLQCAEPGLLVGFGSIAAMRGRTRNAAYAAAKRGLQSYFESLRHALSGSSVVVQFYVLGYMRTNESFGKRLRLFAGDPDRLAQLVYNRRMVDFGRVHFPVFWRFVRFVLRRVPWFLYRRLSF